MILKKVISGGQTGADQAGLYAARYMNINTGGWIPKGYKTKSGPNLSLKKFNLTQHASDKYAPRTELNVKESDGTIRFAYDFKSPGERCTLKAIRKYHKPYLDINLNNLEINDQLINKICEWIVLNKIKVLNVAGNANSKSKSVFSPTYLILLDVFQKLKNEKEYLTKIT